MIEFFCDIAVKDDQWYSVKECDTTMMPQGTKLVSKKYAYFISNHIQFRNQQYCGLLFYCKYQIPLAHFCPGYFRRRK